MRTIILIVVSVLLFIYGITVSVLYMRQIEKQITTLDELWIVQNELKDVYGELVMSKARCLLCCLDGVTDEK